MMRSLARAGLAILLALALAGCQAVATPSPETEAVPTVTVAPATTTPQGAPRLISRHIDAAPVIDGHVEDAWDRAQLVVAPLFWGLDGDEHALDVQLAAMHTDEAVYFLARWPGDALPADIGDTVNKLIIHWRLPDPAEGLAPPSCLVACHTAFADAQGSFSYVHPETIPVGSSESLPFGGGWQDGTWTLEWSRPRVNANPFDLQLADAGQPYRFFVKVLEWVEGKPDPISKWQFLVLDPG